MHPAYSVLFFTTASGAGYGLLMLLGVAGALGLVAPVPALGLVAYGLAFALVTAGLLSSTAHLGRPERAWRAFSQWRSSWLSREGVLAIVTYPVAGLSALGWVFASRTDGIFAVSGLLHAALALATVIATGQIYATLTTIRHWHQPTTTPVYVALALASGALVWNALLIGFGQHSDGSTFLTALLLAAAFALKTLHWARADAPGPSHDATGLGRLGGTLDGQLARVRPLDPPHTQANFVMREMGYTVARRHAARLRQIATLLLFGLPLLATLMTVPATGLPALPMAGIAVMSAAVGVFLERWLFFAEARHVVTLYYGAQTA
jgi:sulfite dehydrogenase (quinone) subunit SoeC